MPIPGPPPIPDFKPLPSFDFKEPPPLIDLDNEQSETFQAVEVKPMAVKPTKINQDLPQEVAPKPIARKRPVSSDSFGEL